MVQQRQIIYTILIATAILAFFCYNPFLLYFQNDDLVHIPLSRDGVLLQHNSFRPVCDLSIMLDYKLWKENAYGYHFTNLVLHLINTLFTYVLAKKILKKYSANYNAAIIAFATAVLFWIYMNHSEAVFWILGRSAMLGMIFFLPACIYYLSREKKISFILSIMFSFLAWMSYESTYILPILFILITCVDARKKIIPAKQEIFNTIIVIISFAVFLGVRFYFTGNLSTEYEKGNLSGGSLILAGNYIKLMMRSWLPPFQNSTIIILLFIMLIGLISFLITRFKNKSYQSIILALIVCLFISLLPYITLSIDTKGLESERFIYLPSFFVCLITSMFIFHLPKFWPAVVTAIIFSLNIVLINSHAHQYQFAGNIVRTTITAVNSLPQKNKLEGINIPQENHGALIFRSGFTEGINWLKKNNIDSITEISQSSTDLPLQKNYPVKFTNNLLLLDKHIAPNRFDTGSAYFLYTDSCLYVVTSAR